MTRYVIFGAGAIGGSVGASLSQHGAEVVLIARGEHLNEIREHGLHCELPSGAVTLHLQAVGRPSEIDLTPEDIVLFTMKSQHTEAAAQELATCAPAELSVGCMQNGVTNERTVLRYFRNVYGLSVRLPAAFLTPGSVAAFGTPTLGTCDVGRYPYGIDARAIAIADDLTESSISSVPQEHIMRWKYSKFLHNIQATCDVLFGLGTTPKAVKDEIHAEGVAVLDAAKIERISETDMVARRAMALSNLAAGESPLGGSSWQSVARNSGSIETDYLNGEVCLLGRIHGVSTPYNDLVQRLSREIVRHQFEPGSIPERYFLECLDSSGRQPGQPIEGDR